jgi:hypothetical protein
MVGYRVGHPAGQATRVAAASLALVLLTAGLPWGSAAWAEGTSGSGEVTTTAAGETDDDGPSGVAPEADQPVASEEEGTAGAGSSPATSTTGDGTPSDAEAPPPNGTDTQPHVPASGDAGTSTEPAASGTDDAVPRGDERPTSTASGSGSGIATTNSTAASHPSTGPADGDEGPATPAEAEDGPAPAPDTAAVGDPSDDAADHPSGTEAVDGAEEATTLGEGDGEVLPGDDVAPGDEEPTATGDDEGQQPAGGVTLVRSGNAIAAGSISENHVVQVVDVLVADGGSVRVEQVILVINLGTGRASSGDNLVLAALAEHGEDAVLIRTGDAIAVGNLTATELDQRLAVVAGQDDDVLAGQVSVVTNTGIALAVTGDNVAASALGALGGSGIVRVRTGDGYAIGNLSEVLILQDADVRASGDARVATDQQASVVNRGLAIADSGGNLALAGGGPASGSSLTTGTALAEGNVAVTDVHQRAFAVATGDSTILLRQGALVLNVGIALARTGGNALGTVDGMPAGAELVLYEEAVLEIVLADVSELVDLGDRLLTWLSALLGLPLELLGAQADERVTDIHDAATGSVISLLQRTLVFDLGFASASSGENRVVSRGDIDAPDPAALEAARAATAAIITGRAEAIGNLAVTLVCQRLSVNSALEAPRCQPDPPKPAEEPETPVEAPEKPGGPAPAPRRPASAPPTPRPAPPIHAESPEPDEVERTAATTPVAPPPSDGGAAPAALRALPVTGAALDSLARRGGAGLALGLLLLALSRRDRRTAGGREPVA